MQGSTRETSISVGMNRRARAGTDNIQWLSKQNVTVKQTDERTAESTNSVPLTAKLDA